MHPVPPSFALTTTLSAAAFWVMWAGPLSGAELAEPMPVGVATIDITPNHPVRLSGYGNRRAETLDVAQHLFAKALVVGNDDGDGPAIWIVYENCGLTPAIRTAVSKQLAEKARVRDERLVISVTHSHTAPCLTGWAPYIFGEDIPADHQRHIDQYTDELTAKLVEVALQALANRRPSRLSWGRGRVGFAVNRRVLKEGQWTGFGIQADGPVDHSLPLLAVHDESGKLTACLATYACHCTTLGGNFNRIAGDWAGYAQAAIEADHPGCTALVTIGCGADANPNPRQDDLAVCERQGRELADEVKRLLATELHPLRGPVACRLEFIDLPFATLRTRDQWQAMVDANDSNSYYARKYLERIDRGEKIPATYPYPVSTWTWGDDLAWVFLGGEVVVDYAIRLREEFAEDRLWIMAYSNDVPGYIASRRILREGGYEADRSMSYYARPQRWSEEVETLILDAVQRLLPHSYYSAAKQTDFPGPKSAAESLDTLRLLPGWRAELVASEPLIEDPVAFDWGPDGRLWVAEMCDYPNGMAWKKPGDPLGVPGGRIQVLTDVDGDGKYDEAKLFLDGIPFPNGIKVWRHGVLITAAPAVLFAADTNGDGVADERRELFTGFVEGNQQHRANGLRFGVDNWLYIANGDSGGQIKSNQTGDVVSISGRDVRIDPDRGLVEAQSGPTQFGRCRDDWNQWFGGNNANPLWHYVLDDHYLRRNRYFSPPSVRRDVPEVPGTAPVFPASRTLARFNDFHTANRFTSACSPEIYRDDLLRDALAGGEDGSDIEHVFICEPVHNLVHHSVLRPEGLSFRSRRTAAEQATEFFASSDNWSRPVMARTGPDGAVWIADMYRQVIEHPEWIPWTSQRKLDLRAGTDRGRIYRVYPQTVPPRRPTRLDQLDTPQLVAALKHPNGWQRDLVQQMLIWKRDPTAVPALVSLVTQSSQPLARLHALGTLDGLGALEPAVVVQAVRDPHPGIRRHAVRLSEHRALELPEHLGLWREVARDTDPHVRLQLAYSLGEWRSPDAGGLLAELVLSSPEDEILLAAAMSSVNSANLSAMVAPLLAAPNPPIDFVEQLLGVAFQLGDKKESLRTVRAVMASAATRPVAERLGTARGLLDALRRRNVKVEVEFDADTAAPFLELSQTARTLVSQETAAPAERLLAVRFLEVNLRAEAEDAELLTNLLSPRTPPELQLAAVKALASRFSAELTPRSLAGWKSHSPVLRAQILDEVLSRPNATLDFLAALSRGDVPTSHVDARRRQQLAAHRDARIREQANQLFQNEGTSSRTQVVEQFAAALNAPGDAAQGRAIFTKRCAVCHRLEGQGQAVGPDLTALTDKSPRSLLLAIMDPNRAVEDKFLDYLAVTGDGRQFTGILTDETSNSVTLTGQEAKRNTLSRVDLEVLQSSGKSLMPEGIEKDVSPTEIRDVIAYVRSVSIPPKSFPGNHPELAHVRDDGSIRMLALNAKIFGPTLVFEDKYRNLGYWQSSEDHATWELNVPKAGRYQVHLEYACEDGAAGGRFVLSIAGQSVGGVVRGTGSWDQYRGQVAGTVDLSAGPAELLIRSDGPIRSALFDLRQIVLEPE